MGSLSGHLLPGSFFLLFGLWWTASAFYKYFLALKDEADDGNSLRRKRGNSKYKNSASFPCFCSRRVPIEGVIKVTSVTIGMIAEYVTAYRDGEFVYYGNLQHMTIYFFFGLNGVADILQSYDQSLIPNLDYVTGALAYLMEGLLFFFHIDGQPKIEARVHILLVITIFGGLISIICEALYKNSILPCLGRVYFTLLQGTWFIQIGLTLFVFKYGSNSMKQMKLVTFIFAWHVAAVFVFLLLSGYLIRFLIKLKKGTPRYEAIYLQPRKGNYYDRKEHNLQEALIFTESEEEV